MRLDTFNNDDFDRGAPRCIEAIWLFVDAALLGSWLPGSKWRVWLLRLFGSQIEKCVVLKPRLRVKFPWRLEVGSYSWLGEGVWIDNLATVRIGAHCCVSQGTYFCTGSHDWNKESFDLITTSITLDAHAWVGANCTLAPGTHLREGAVLAVGSVAKGELAAWTISAGNFAEFVGSRLKR